MWGKCALDRGQDAIARKAARQRTASRTAARVANRAAKARVRKRAAAQASPQAAELSLSPMMPSTISAALATRATLTASPIMTMPNTNAPTAPIPVQTA